MNGRGLTVRIVQGKQIIAGRIALFGRDPLIHLKGK